MNKKIDNKFIKNKRILITGVCGTIGSALVRLLLNDKSYNPTEVIGLDNNESGLFFLEQEFLKYSNVSFSLADIRDQDKLSYKMSGIDIVFHAAALKHVILCERSPFESVQTNINGVQNVILAAMRNQVERVIFTSTDKAVNPTNVMGTSKLMGERLMTAANSNMRDKGSCFSSTRFGNVLGSNGSVIPVFHKQIAKGGPVTITDPEMTRFIMSIEQAVRLVVNSAELARGGEVFITKMPVVRIQDLAEVMINELADKYGYEPKDIEIVNIGIKPGEKLYEELMSHEEMRRTMELRDYFAVLPAFRGIYRNISYDYPSVCSEHIEKIYNSANETPISQNELQKVLMDAGLLTPESVPVNQPAKRFWPGDKD